MKEMALWNEGDWIAAIALVVLIAFLSIGAMVAASRKPEFLGHPKGLYMLFFAEMWERFSYYGMRALLIFYLTQHWLFSDGESTLIYGAYTALVYITPVLGGYLADRYLGQRKAVLFGGLLLVFGHSFMAVEGMQGVTDPLTKQADPAINVFWLALALIIVGSGFLKANISVMVGQLYRLTDIRRDSAYTIFYMGINAGAAFGVILAGYLGQTIGWAYGFGLAGIGMLAGLIVFVLGKKVLNGAGEPPEPLTRTKEMTLYGTGLVAVAVMWALVQYVDVIETLLMVSGVALLGWVLYQAFKLPKEPRERIFAILFLVALNPLFWGLFEQAGGTLNLYTDRYVDRGDVPASVFQSINSIYIILFAPVFAALWALLGRKGIEPSAPAKFALALLQVGLGFLIFVWGANTVGPDDPGAVRVPDLPAAHHGRALPEPGRPVGDEPPRPGLHGQPCHGRVVLHVGRRQLRGRQDRRGHGRRKRRHDQGRRARDLQPDRLGRDRGWRGGPGAQPDREEVDAPRHAARRGRRPRRPGTGGDRSAASGNAPGHRPAGPGRRTGRAIRRLWQ